jgi:uncharacterized membrane protein (DUF485 family)
MLSEALTTLKPLYLGGDSWFFFNQTQTKRTIIKMGVIRMANLAQTNTSDMGGKRGQGIDYSAIARSEKFKKLMQAKKRFIVPMCIFFMVFYYTLPIMTSYSKVLNTPAIGSITWAWIYAFGQFIMTWALCMIYTRKANSFDSIANEIIEEQQKGGRN